MSAAGSVAQQATRTTAGGRPWLALVAMTGAQAMVMLDQTVVTVALPTMSRELPMSATGAQWVVSAYVLAMAALLAVGGKLGDRFGAVSAFRVGVVLFATASVGCGLAPVGGLGEPVVVICRLFQGAGAALMVPASAAVVISAFGPAQRGRAMALYAGLGQIFLAAGPVVGGFLTQAVSWRAVFWLNVPVAAATLALVAIARPDNARRSNAPVRLLPVVFLVTGIGATVLAVQQGGTWSWTSPATVITLVAGLTLTAVFVLSQRRSSNPVVDIRLLTRPDIAPTLAVLGLIQFGLLPVVVFASIYLQHLLGFDPIQAGLAMLPVIVPITLAAQIGGRWYDRFGIRRPVLVGLVTTSVGLAAWTATLPLLDYRSQLVGMVLTGLGIGLMMSPLNTDPLSRVQPADRGQTSGLVQTVRQLGGTLGVAVISGIVLGVEQPATGSPYRMADALTLGFAAAALTYVLALVLAYRLLPRRG